MPARDLRWTCPTTHFRKRGRSGGAADPDPTFGQGDAVEALHLAVALRAAGPCVFVSGPPATDPVDFALGVLDRAVGRVRVPDRVFLPDDVDPLRARLLALPPGAGAPFVRALERVLDTTAAAGRQGTGRGIGRELDALRARFDDPRAGDALDRVSRAAARRDGVRFRPTLASRGRDGSAPVVHERHPSEARLFGGFARDRDARTEETCVRFFGGSLLRADGGFLVIEARDLLDRPDLWRGTMKAVRDRRFEIPPLRSPTGDDDLGLLRPDAIPLRVQVVLVGDEGTYAGLFDQDPEFRDLVSIKATLEVDAPRTEAAIRHYARCMRDVVAGEGLLPFEEGASAAVVEEGVRQAGRRHRITLCLGRVVEWVREASHEAGQRGARRVARQDVLSARARAARRLGVLDRHVREAILAGRILLDTEGSRVGVLNGLAVYDYGNLGKVARISATVGPGSAGIVNVEREVALSASSYDKGIHILAGYLTHVFARESPASFSARIVFEQSYGGITGDSATIGETCAVLSALSRVPLRQSLAVTGSMNQHGEVQAIGGVNDKIEGFFDLCAARGLGGDHGVVIPRSNVEDLMLRPDVVEACREGRFAVFAVDRVEEALEILAGRPAGDRGEPGSFVPGSVLAAAAERLDGFARFQRGSESGPGPGRPSAPDRRA